MNIEIWDCGIDPKKVKEKVTLSLNRQEIKFLLHKLMLLKKSTNNDLQKYMEELENSTSEEYKECLEELVTVCELDIRDLDALIKQFLN
ncbi:hypothetical protein HEMROJRC1_20490 [Rodentibacter sp. JRC1]|uniref:hypothetical protein n=1 Tax=Rodentibacter sp. JRC1 TaxID=2874504 RepID=UPI001CFDD140|nr:hypothetical protein [Rodentibacter sp. JRC1]GJI56937.1 hypothetical protein HEMROJRC1_20490 [Rodentibacter sp. JRC1]